MFQESQNRVRSMALAERLYQPKDLARNGKFTLLVSDNSVGLLEDLDFRNTKSLGLQLVNTLVDQLEGTIELDRRDGTAFKITFAEIKY